MKEKLYYIRSPPEEEVEKTQNFVILPFLSFGKFGYEESAHIRYQHLNELYGSTTSFWMRAYQRLTYGKSFIGIFQQDDEDNEDNESAYKFGILWHPREVWIIQIAITNTSMDEELQGS